MFSHFQIGNSTVHLYNVFLLISFLSAVFYLENEIKKFQFSEKTSTLLRLFVPIAIILGLLGAAFFDMIFLSNNLSFSNLNPGLTFYGGLIVGFLTLWGFAWFGNLRFSFLLNFYSAPLALGHAFGRIGCFFAGCCYGRPTTFFLGVKFPIGSIPYEKHGYCSLHPTQLYESAFLFLLFFLLNKTSYEYRAIKYFVYYGLFRFLIELLRDDPRGKVFNLDLLSPSQIISIILVLFGCFWWHIKKSNQPLEKRIEVSNKLP